MRHNADQMIKILDTYTTKIEVGSKIWFEEEKQGYSVIASNRFYSICTKPFNIKKTCLGCDYSEIQPKQPKRYFL